MIRGEVEWKKKARRDEMPKVGCYRCGRQRPACEMVEVGLDVYICAGGCRGKKAEKEKETHGL